MSASATTSTDSAAPAAQPATKSIIILASCPQEKVDLPINQIQPGTWRAITDQGMFLLL